MSNSINNNIPEVPENTIDPAAGLNLSLNTIDALLQVLVQTVGANTPPVGVEGQRHIVGTAPSGPWAGQANRMARFLDGAYQFFDARYALNAADGLWYVRSASTWAPLAGGGGGGGEANTASNLGAGEGLYATKVGVDLRFKSLVAGTNITLSSDGDEITIDAAGGGGGSGTVTSVALSAPTGFAVSGSPVTTTGTLALAFDTGYSLPTDTNQANWSTAFGWGDHAAAGYEKELTAGANITIDRTDPDNPIISSTASGGGGGDVVGPASAANNGVVLFDGTSGKLLKDGGVLGNAAFTASSAYATAAQGTLAGTALQPAAIGTTVQEWSANLDSWSAIAPSAKQDALVSATNIKTINGASVLGSGDLAVGGLTNPMTAEGDIIIGGTSGVPTRLEKGADEAVLTLVDGLPVWVLQVFSVDYLVIGGGGGGGGNAGGGGGAGGYLAGQVSVRRGEIYPVIIGSGGTAGLSNSPGGNGGNSTFSGLSSVGGGGGGSFNNTTPGNGGSGGGGGGRSAGSALFGSATSGQGSNGGTGSIDPAAGSANLWGGGGGGAGGVGGNATTSSAGSAGSGSASSISGTSVVRSAGGAGGGGASATTGGAGASNTGGGGGGGGSGGSGGAGGSGVVIISYEGEQKATGGTVTTNGTKTVHTFTTSGNLEVGGI